MSAFFSNLRDAARSSVSFRRLAALLVLTGAGAALVFASRSSAPWGAPWTQTAPTPPPRTVSKESGTARLDLALESVFAEAGIDRADIRGRFVPIVTEGDSFSRAELDLPVPVSASFVQLNAGISRAAIRAGASVLDVIEVGRRPGSPQGLEITLGVGDRATHFLKLQREAAPSKPSTGGASPAGPRPPRIALVVDDLGFSMDSMVRALLASEAPLTFGVIAGLKYSAAFAESARAHGHDVILHLPMEPIDLGGHDPGRNAVLTELDADENLRRLRSHLDGLAEYSGVSNHMGSRATADPGVMALVLQEIRGRDRTLYFLDSRTTPFSVVPREGRRAGVRVLVNNLFLDGEGDDGTGIDPRVQLRRVEEIARRRGTAIAIGHVGPDTVGGLRDAVARWRDEGIELVTLSELAGRERIRTTREKTPS